MEKFKMFKARKRKALGALHRGISNLAIDELHLYTFI